MPGIIDCAVLMLPAHAAWSGRWMQQQADRLGRIRLHALWLVDPQSPADAPVPVQALGDAQLALRRYDAGLLPVDYPTLGWTRTALALLPSGERSPMVALVDGLQAPAVQDLLRLGLDDFMREGCPPDDVRARIERQAARARARVVTADAASWPQGQTAPPGIGSGALAQDCCAAESPAGPLLGPAPVFRPEEPFRQAKSRVVATFERDYITRALARHAGNIAMAARAAHKHRRAFWALMRKHGIDAGPYREAARVGLAAAGRHIGGAG
jgi:Transcriptional regulator containing PAS, AAA-type ATPase, and DNA-binding domains